MKALDVWGSIPDGVNILGIGGGVSKPSHHPGPGEVPTGADPGVGW